MKEAMAVKGSMAIYEAATTSLYDEITRDSASTASTVIPMHPWRDDEHDADVLLNAITRFTHDDRSASSAPTASTMFGASCWSPDVGGGLAYPSSGWTTQDSDEWNGSLATQSDRPDSGRSASDVSPFAHSNSPTAPPPQWSPSRLPTDVTSRDSVSYGSWSQPNTIDGMGAEYTTPQETFNRADTEFNLIKQLVNLQVGNTATRAASMQPSGNQRLTCNTTAYTSPPPLLSPAIAIARGAHQHVGGHLGYGGVSPNMITRPRSQCGYTGGGQEDMERLMAQTLIKQQQQRQYEQLCAIMLANGQLPPPLGASTLTPQQQLLMHAHMQQQQQLRGQQAAAPSAHMQTTLDACAEEYRQLEKERKKTEAELARHNLGKRINSLNNIPIPRLPAQPTRVDRLIVDYFREHARLVTLLAKMEWLRAKPLSPRTHACMDEWLTAIKHLQCVRHAERVAMFGGGAGAEASMLAALQPVTDCVRRARAAAWCSLMITLYRQSAPPADTALIIEQIIASDYNRAPPAITIDLQSTVAAKPTTTKTATVDAAKKG